MDTTMKRYLNNHHLDILLLFFVFLSPVSAVSVLENAPEINQTEDIATACHKICGCDRLRNTKNASKRAFIYNASLNECVLNTKYLKSISSTADTGYNNQDHDIANDDGMAKRIRIEAEKVFSGMIISVLIFIASASLCAFSACIYCCHINYSDRKLKNDVKALAKKLKTEYHSRKTVPKKSLEPIEESCNVMLGNTGAFVV